MAQRGGKDNFMIYKFKLASYIITIIMQDINKIQLSEQFSFGEPASIQVNDNEIPVHSSALPTVPFIMESSVEQIVESPPNSPKDQSMLSKKNLRKIISVQKKIWIENNFYGGKWDEQKQQLKMEVFELMGQILQYFLQKYIDSQEQRQKWQQNREACILKTQRIVDILKEREQRQASSEENAVENVISSLKILANQLCLGPINGKDAFLTDILSCDFNSLKFLICAKLALSFQADQSQLSVFSDQSFNPVHNKQHISQKLYGGTNLTFFLNEGHINQMRARLEQIKTQNIRATLLEDLEMNLKVSQLQRKQNCDSETSISSKKPDQNSHNQNVNGNQFFRQKDMEEKKK